MLVPFLAIGEIERIKEIYTTLRQEDIFDVSPFIIKNKNGVLRTKINHIGILTQFLKNKKTLGSSENLRNLIRRSFTSKDFAKLRSSGKEVIITVANLTRQVVEYKSSNNYEYDDFCDWLWASANLIPIMSLLIKNGEEYGDGGFGNLIPVQEVVRQGALSVDVIVLNPEQRVFASPPLHNALDSLVRTYEFMLTQIAIDDLLIARLKAADQHADIHFYYTNRILTEYPYVFDAEQMKKWWQEGYELFQNRQPEKISLK